MNNGQNPFSNLWSGINMPNMGNMGAAINPEQQKAMMETHRKNMETLAKANQVASDVVRSVTQLQSEYMQQTFSDFSHFMTQWTSLAGSPEAMSKAPELMNQGAEIMRENCAKAMDCGNHVKKILQKSHKEMTETMRNRLSQSLDEVRGYSSKPSGSGSRTSKH